VTASPTETASPTDTATWSPTATPTDRPSPSPTLTFATSQSPTASATASPTPLPPGTLILGAPTILHVKSSGIIQWYRPDIYTLDRLRDVPYTTDETLTIQDVDYHVRQGDLDTLPSPPDSAAFQEPLPGGHWGPVYDYANLDFVATQSAALVSPEDSPLVRARKLFLFVKNNIGYMSDAIDVYENPEEVVLDPTRNQLEILLRDRKGNCAVQSLLFVALCRTNPQPIPARVVCGELLSPDGRIEVHHWAEFYLEDIGSIPVDPTRSGPDSLTWFGHTDIRHFSTRYLAQLPPGVAHFYFLKPDNFEMRAVASP
jgi:transglutaminase-like putative cysteine protease